MAEILCSIGTLLGKPNGNDYRLLETFTKQINCDGYEFMMCSSWYDKIDEIIEFCHELGLNFPVYHCRKSIGENISLGEEGYNEAFREFEINCKMAHSLGSKRVVLHLWSGMISDTHFENNIKAYPMLKQIADDNYVDLLVENIVCNNKSQMERICELATIFSDIHFVFDTKMAAFHGQLELLYEPEYSFLLKNIRHYHVNDYGGGLLDWAHLKTLPIGEGNIDFERFFNFINNTGYNDTFTIESPVFDSEGNVDIDVLNKQIEYIKDRLQN